MTYEVGDRVTVKPPFNESFPDTCVITEIVENDDGMTVYILGDAGGFDAIYLERIQ